jgi:hypothetical protein
VRGGAPVGAGARPADARHSIAGALPWAVAGIALLALIALVAGQRFNATRGAPGGASGEVAGAIAAPAPATDARAPDISGLSQREIADRLYDRIMRLDQEGKRDSVLFFAPMALQVYQSSAPLDLDQRYDYGRVAEVSGDLALARAQADTILRASASHLLGLALAARVARAAGDGRRAAEYGRRLVAAAPRELATRRPEYQRHRADIEQAIREAKGSG